MVKSKNEPQEDIFICYLICKDETQDSSDQLQQEDHGQTDAEL